MNIQSQIPCYNGIFIQQPRIQESRVLQSKKSFENIPSQTLYKKNNCLIVNQKDQQKNNYSMMQAVKSYACLTTPRQSINSQNYPQLLNNAEKKRNSLQIYNQPQFIKIIEKKNHIKNNSLIQIPQTQTALSKSPSCQSINSRVPDQINILDLVNQSSQRELGSVQDITSRVLKETDLNITIDQLIKNTNDKKKMQEQQSVIYEDTQFKTNSPQNIKDQWNQENKLLSQKLKEKQNHIDQLNSQLQEKGIQFQNYIKKEVNNNQYCEGCEMLKNERDQLKKAMNDILKKIENVLLENQQLNKQVQEVNQLKQQNNEQFFQVQQQQIKINTLKNELETIKLTHQNELKQIIEQKSSQIKEIEQLKQIVENKKQFNNEEFDNKMNLMVDHSHYLQQQLNQLKNERSSLQLNSDRLINQNESLYSKLNSQTEKILQLNEKLSQYEEENKNLKKVKDQNNYNDQELQHQVDDLESKILDLVNENENLGKYLQQQQENFDKLYQQDQDLLQQQITKLKNENEFLKNEVKHKQLEIASLKKLHS